MGTSLRDVYQKLETLASTSSTNDKIELLKGYLVDPIFRRVCWCTYTSTLSFKVKAFPAFKPTGFCERGWEEILPILKHLSGATGADNAIKQKLFQASMIDKETLDVVARICDGDLKCGIAARTINKARPNTIKIWSYKRCSTSKHIDNITFEPYAIAQCKADGTFTNLFIREDKSIDFYTRVGQPIKCLEFLKKKIKDNPPKLLHGRRGGINHCDSFQNFKDKVYQGELRVFTEDGKIMPRKQGNGLINECIKGTIDPKIAKRVFFTCWTVVTIQEFFNGESETNYLNASFNAVSFVKRVDDERFVRFIESENVTSLEEAYAFYRRMRAQGEEGAIVKNIEGIWEDNQSGSKDDIKLKHSFEADVKIVGWNYGTKGSKYENCKGSVIIESECGKLRCNVSGFTDQEREWDWDMMIDSIITVEAESVIFSKSKDTASLYTPSFIEIREDKTTANTLEEIIEIAEESKKIRRRKA